MHTEILSQEQSELFPYLKRFQRSFYLVGGTAIALHIGHRRSIDFDLFTQSDLIISRIKKTFWKSLISKNLFLKTMINFIYSLIG